MEFALLWAFAVACLAIWLIGQLLVARRPRPLNRRRHTIVSRLLRGGTLRRMP